MSKVHSDFLGRSFTCPHCKIRAAAVEWYSIENYRDSIGRLDLVGPLTDRVTAAQKPTLFPGPDPLETYGGSERVVIGACRKCDGLSLWLAGSLVYPVSSTVEDADEDMPQQAKVLYEEAARILPLSPRAAAALLRAATDKLAEQIEPQGSDLNDRIRHMVKNGLSTEVANGLDVMRLTGNDAIHCLGEIILDNKEEDALPLFSILNIIVRRMVTEPKQIKDAFGKLPKDKKKSIEKRDGQQGS